MFMIISQHHFCQIHGYSLRPWCFDNEHDAHRWTRLRVLHPQRVCNPCLRLDYGRGEEVWFEALWVLRPASSEDRKVLRLLGSGLLTLIAHICSCLNGKSGKNILEYDCRTSTATPLQWNVAEPSDVKWSPTLLLSEERPYRLRLPLLSRNRVLNFSSQMEQGVKKLFVMLLLDPVEHSSDLDPWPWGGESIFRNDKFCGTVSCFLLTLL